MKKLRCTEVVDEPLPAASTTDWSELPQDALVSIFGKLGAMEILMGAGLVCRSWLQAATLPDLWRSVDMAHHKLLDDDEEGRSCSALAEAKRKINGDVLCAMASVAVDRSGGQMEEFVARYFVTNELLNYLGDRSQALKTLGLFSCFNVTNQGLTDVAAKCPLLEDLKIVDCNNVGGRDVYESIGMACPQLNHFTLHRAPPRVWKSSGEALGVATMHELRSLTLSNSDVTNNELLTVLDGCPRLELLDVCGCFNIVDNNALRARCPGITSLMPITSPMPPYTGIIDLSSDSDDDHWDWVSD